MSLRFRLIALLSLVALVPLVIALAIPLGQAERRAELAARLRLDRAGGVASVVLKRHLAEIERRQRAALLELARDEALQRRLLQGPETVAQLGLEGLARRFDLDLLIVTDADGVQLGALGERNAAIQIEETLTARGESMHVTVGSVLSRDLVDSAAELTGATIALLDPAQQNPFPLAARIDPDHTLTTTLPIGTSRWVLKVMVPSGDVKEVRRETWLNFARIAPLALAGALLLGLIVAHRLARPLQTLTERAEELARDRARPILLSDDRNEVRRLESALDQLLTALEESEKRRDQAQRIAAWEEVARRLAHEVKNPLSPIKLAVENLQRAYQKTPDRFETALGEESATILDEVESLRRLVDEFSQFARAPALQLAPCSPRELIHKCVMLFRPRIERLGVELAIETDGAPTQIVADAEQIGRVLKNVVSNALDALQDAPNRRLLIRANESGADSLALLVIEVIDSGVGLSPELERRAFEPYFTTRSGSGGTGLGLAIAQRIVAEHRGTIELRAVPEGGAVSVLKLPLDPPRA